MDTERSIIHVIKNTERPILGSFPLYPPLELFHSLGLKPIILWGFKNVIKNNEKSTNHLQDYVCSIAHHLTEFLLSDLGKYFDGIFYYNACDTLRNLPEVLLRNIEEKRNSIPYFRIHIPMSSLQNNYSVSYLKTEIGKLIKDLEETFDLSFSKRNFKKSTELYDEVRNLYHKLESKVTSGVLSFSSLVEFLVKFNFYDPEALMKDYKTSLVNWDKNENVRPGTSKIILSGILPPSESIIQTIESAGFTIVGNDIALMNRIVSKTPENKYWDDPRDYYLEFYKNHIPCPTLLYSSDERIEYLRNLIERKNAEGVIFLGEKYCEYEYFEFPYLKKKLSENNIKVLDLEFSKDDISNIDSVRTRIEAFRELF